MADSSPQSGSSSETALGMDLLNVLLHPKPNDSNFDLRILLGTIRSLNSDDYEENDKETEEEGKD